MSRKETLKMWSKGFFHPPVYIFQMGKVGSASLLNTLRENYSGHVFHVHSHNKLSKFQKQLVEFRKFLHLPVYVITPIRDPISRNVSAFFQNFERFTGNKISDRPWNADQLKMLFLEKSDHAYALEWCDQHLHRFLGIDVYQKTFPVQRKSSVFRDGSLKLLVYRTDLDRTEQLKTISDFLGIQLKEWIISNVSVEKDYGNSYRLFIQNVKLPEPYISEMKNSTFFHHFWTEDERSDLCEAWVD